MTGWQVTAKTIYCEAVDDEVTVLVYRDGTSHCTGFKKYTQPNEITRKTVLEKTRRLKRKLGCEGELCPYVIQYKEKILTEKSG